MHGINGLIIGTVISALAAGISALAWSMLFAERFTRAARSGRMAMFGCMAIIAVPVYMLAAVCLVTGRTQLLGGAFLGAMPYLLLLLPAIYLTRDKPTYCTSRPTMTICFTLAGCLILIFSAVGFDRCLQRIDGQFLLTLPLFFLWYAYKGRPALRPDRAASTSPIGQNPTTVKPKLITFQTVLACCTMIVTCTVLVIASKQVSYLARVFALDPQLLAAVALQPIVVCATLPMVRLSNDIGQLVESICIYSLIVFATLGIFTIIAGPIRFGQLLWQVEAFGSLAATLLWLGLLRPGNRFGRGESLAITSLFVLYLLVRITSMLGN